MLVRDAQDYIKRPAICKLSRNKIINSHEMKVLLTSLDHTLVPRAVAQNVLNEIYSNRQYLPRKLNSVCEGTYFVVKHLEAVC